MNLNSMWSEIDEIFIQLSIEKTNQTEQVDE